MLLEVLEVDQDPHAEQKRLMVDVGVGRELDNESVHIQAKLAAAVECLRDIAIGIARDFVRHREVHVPTARTEHANLARTCRRVENRGAGCVICRLIHPAESAGVVD